MKEKSEKIDISKVLSSNKEITENDVLALIILMEEGRIQNPTLMKKLNLRRVGANTPETAGYYRRKLEKMGIIEGYPAKINWEKIGYPTEFVVIATSQNKKGVLEIEKRHIAVVKWYKEVTGASIGVIPLSEKGDKVILKDVLFCGQKPMAVITGMATDDGAAMMYADLYLPKLYPGIDTARLIIKRSSIRDFEFQDELIESVKEVLFDEGEIERYREAFRKEFRWDLLSRSKK